MSEQENAEAIVENMFSKDTFSQWLGIEVIRVSPGQCSLKMQVNDEMLNGHGIAHGGISYSLSDSCLAFASNSRGIKAVSIETSIAHTRPIKEGDVLHAISEELQLGKTLARYTITVFDQDDRQVSIFHGTVFRNGKFAPSSNRSGTTKAQ